MRAGIEGKSSMEQMKPQGNDGDTAVCNQIVDFHISKLYRLQQIMKLGSRHISVLFLL